MPTFFVHYLQNDWFQAWAFFILRSSSELAEFVSPICLPSSDEVGETFVGETMTVSGWGRESDSSSSIARVTKPTWVLLNKTYPTDITTIVKFKKNYKT